MTPTVPVHLRSGMQLYLERGMPQGSFLSAVLRNDLREAIRCADSSSLARLPELVLWLYEYAPSTCWGGPAVVATWMTARQAEIGGARRPMAVQACIEHAVDHLDDGATA